MEGSPRRPFSFSATSTQARHGLGDTSQNACAFFKLNSFSYAYFWRDRFDRDHKNTCSFGRGVLLIDCYFKTVFARITNASKQEGATNRPPFRKAQERGTIMNVKRTLTNWRNYRRTVAELERMTTRELADLGITQYEIRSFARTAHGF